MPTPKDTWKDIKVHGGLRGELQTVFKAARQISMGTATAASLFLAGRRRRTRSVRVGLGMSARTDSTAREMCESGDVIVQLYSNGDVAPD